MRGKAVLAALSEQGGQIADGYTNLFLANMNLLSEEAQAVYSWRMGQCIVCPVRSGNACSKHQKHKRVDADCYVHGCGCGLAAATKSPSKWCPLHKWPPVDIDTLSPMPYPADKASNPCTKR